MPDMQLLTPKDVQKLLKCSLPYVYKVAGNGLLPCVRIPCAGDSDKRKKDMVRFKREDVWHFIDKHYRG